MSNDVAPQLIVEMLKQGLLGVLLVVAVYAIAKLYAMREADRVQAIADLKAAHDAQIADARAHHVEQLELMRTAVTAISNQANANLAMKESTDELGATLAEYNETLRQYLDDQRRDARSR